MGQVYKHPMNLPPPQLRPQPEREAPVAIVCFITREDVLWNRPIFKAPPLFVTLPPAAPLFPVNSATANQVVR